MSIKKIKVLSRNPDNYMRETKRDIHKVPRNYNPDLHPLEAVREYKEALNATKLERIFAKPFVSSFSHSDSVTAICRHPSNLSNVYTGTHDGQLSLWNLPYKRREWSAQAHGGQVWSIISAPNGQSFFSVGNDKTIKRWLLQDAQEGKAETASDTWLCDTMVTGITHHRYNNEFITCGERVLLWDASTKAPKSSYDWDVSSGKNEASVVCVKFNPVESSLFASGDHANNLVLYDVRVKEVKKLKMTMRINALDWNPMEAFMLTTASEDYNCYTFDIRYMDSDKRIVSIHQGHTKAVLDVYYSPTGKEFASASFDKSVRIFPVERQRSRDIYHGKRMFKVNCVLWTADSKFILSGSSDHNVRVWKAVSHEKLGQMHHRETAAMNYANELKRKYAHFPEIGRILRHRHLPQHIYKAKQELANIKDSQDRKSHNRITHSKPGSVPLVPERSRVVVGLQDEMEPEEEEDEPPWKRMRGSFRGRGGSGRPSFRGRGGSGKPSFRGRGGSGGPSSRGRGGSRGPSSRGRGGSGGPSSRGRGGSGGPSSRGRGGSGKPSFRGSFDSGKPSFRGRGGPPGP